MIDIKSLQILAIQATETPDWDAFYRKICRWYSEKFSTPLHHVENELTEEHVMRHYYESSFQDLKGNPGEEAQKQYTELRDSILFEKELEEKQVEDDDWIQQMHEDIGKDAKPNDYIGNANDSDELLKNPNLLDEELNINVQGEDGPPDF